jgi:hypothetical protein
MVIFDQNAIAQGVSVVGATAERNSPFLKPTPTRKRFPGIQNTDRVPADGSTKLFCQGSDPGQILKKIQGDSFGLQDGSPIPFDLKQQVSVLGSVAVPLGDGES